VSIADRLAARLRRRTSADRGGGGLQLGRNRPIGLRQINAKCRPSEDRTDLLGSADNREAIDVMNIFLLILVVVILLSIVQIRELRAFRKTQNTLLIEVICAGLMSMEDKINILLRDRGYDQDKVARLIEQQKEHDKRVAQDRQRGAA